MEINLHITDDAVRNLNWAAEIAMEAVANGETPSLADIREMLVPFMTDARGTPLDEEQARRLLGRIKAAETEGVAKQFSTALQDFLSQRQNGSPVTSGLPVVAAARRGSPRSTSRKSGAVPLGKSSRRKRR